VRERRNYLLILGAIAALLVGAVLLAVPGSPAYKKPTLGLDLQGGLEVVLRAVPQKGQSIDPQQMQVAQQVITQRVNSIGLASPNIAIQGGNEIVIQLAGVHDVAKAAKTIGSTGQLQMFDFETSLVPPTLSFAVTDLQYVLTFAVMLAVGLVVGQLTAGLRYQARIAMHRERRSHSLFEVARALSGELVVDQVVETASKAIEREFRARVRIYVLSEDDRLTLARGDVDTQGLDPGTARWAFDHRQAAGLGTDTIPGSSWHYLPLNASMRTRGVLAFQPESPRLFAVPEQRRQLETFAALTAIALERVHYVDVAQKATVQIESERLRNSLLSALSHDLRTPLAGLTGLAESLRMTEPSLSAAQHEIAEELVSSAIRMSAQVNNLLDMARFESGEFRLTSSWNSVEEMIGSAVRLSKRVLASRTLKTDVPADLPLVKCDAVLIERVLVNLLENSAKYTPPDAIVEIVAQSVGEEMRVTVVDNGPGIRPGSEQEIFNKFSRGVRESAISGVGLGLAICKAIVEAHGGSISAANRGGRGAAFTFTLPISKEQPLAPEADEFEVTE